LSLRARPRTTFIAAFALLLSALVTVVALSSPAAAEGTVTVNVTGQGSVTGDGINCNQSGGDCSEPYFDECTDPPQPVCIPPQIELTAAGDNGFALDYFTGCTSTNGAVCSVTVTSPRTVTVVFRDNVPPTVVLTSPGPAPVRGAVNLTASSTDNVGVNRVEFRVRGVTVATDSTAPYSGSFSSSSFADGSASVTAMAVDTSGNSATTAGTYVTIDNSAPSLSVTGPSGQVYGPGTTQAWTISATDPTTGVLSVHCSLVAAGSPASFGACSEGTSGHSVTNKPEGSYELAVRASDNAGNAAEVNRTFIIDATPPDTSVISGPGSDGVVASRMVTFGFAATESGSTFQCRLYSAGTTAPAFAPCSGANLHSASGLSDGRYRFEVQGSDAVGNVDASPAVRQFTVDATAPQATFTKQPRKKVKTRKKKAKVTFAFVAEPGAAFRCSLDGAAFSACPASVSYKLKPGRHTFQVVAVDAAGNVQAAPTTSTFKVKRVTTRR
jgi:hypothetical protein